MEQKKKDVVKKPKPQAAQLRVDDNSTNPKSNSYPDRVNQGEREISSETKESEAIEESTFVVSNNVEEINWESTFVVLVSISGIELDDETILMEMLSGKYFRLNATGTYIWRLVLQKFSLGEIGKQLARSFSLDSDEANEFALSFIKDLVKKGILTVVVKRSNSF